MLWTVRRHVTRYDAARWAGSRSFWQPRLVQGIGPPRKVLRSVNPYNRFGVGKAHARVQLPQAFHRLARLDRSPGQGGARRGQAVHNLHIWAVTNGRLRPGERLVVAPGHEMGEGQSTLDAYILRIMGAEALGADDACDSLVYVADPGLDPAAVEPSPGQVRIEAKGCIDEGVTVIDVADQDSEREARCGKSHGIVMA